MKNLVCCARRIHTTPHHIHTTHHVTTRVYEGKGHVEKKITSHSYHILHTHTHTHTYTHTTRRVASQMGMGKAGYTEKSCAVDGRRLAISHSHTRHTRNTHSLTNERAKERANGTHSLTHSFTHSLTYSLTHSLTHSFTHSPTDCSADPAHESFISQWLQVINLIRSFFRF